MKTLKIVLSIEIDGENKYAAQIDLTDSLDKGKVSPSRLHHYCDGLARAAARTIQKNYPEIIDEDEGGG